MKKKNIMIIGIVALIVVIATAVLLVLTSKNKNYTILDETKECINILYKIYEDDEATYYLTCEKEVYLKYENGVKVNIKDALIKKDVTIEELKAKGVTILEAKKKD